MNRPTKRFIVLLCLLFGLTACDLLGNGPDLEPPTVTGVSPNNDATGVAINKSVIANLNLPNGDVDKGTLTPDAVRLVKANDGSQVTATLTAIDDRITLNPEDMLEPNTQYRFEVTSNLKDERGAKLEPFTSTFTTGTQIAEENPSVIGILPSNGATNVSRNETVVADLDLPNGDVDNDTLTPNTVRLVRGDNGAQVSATVSATGEKTITLAPDDQLEPNTEYRFEVTSGVEDLEGESFVPFTSTFTTGTKMNVERPSVQSSTPADGATNISLDTDVITNLSLPGSGVDPATFNSGTVRLIKVDDEVQVAASLGTSGGNDVITLSPRRQLEPNTRYRFEVTSGVKNLDEVSFVPYTATFTTGTERGNVSTVAFTSTTVVTGDDRHTTLVIGPDGKLYATTVDGRIKRFTIQADGTLSAPQVISSLQSAENGPRLLIGFAFDPGATADNLVVWVSHTYAGFVNPTINQPWSGKISRLSGPNLENVQDYVVGLPRSFKDHVTNSVAFGPDGALYFNQGANNAMGAPDSTWRWQPERLLNASILRLDIAKANAGSLPINAKTEDGGTYNPFAPNAPLTIYARGVRNAYDLVWHSNGQLYAPANGSAAGGVIPRFDASPGDSCETRPEGGYGGPRLTASRTRSTPNTSAPPRSPAPTAGRSRGRNTTFSSAYRGRRLLRASQSCTLRVDFERRQPDRK